MNDRELAEFTNAWLPAQEITGKEPSDGALILAFNLMKKYSLVDIKKGLIAHLTDPALGRFAPKPANVIFQIERINHDGRLEADEAWSIAIKFLDENQTVVVNDEIAGALQLAGDIYADGDKTGARMAFRASYEKNVAQARKEGKPVRWWPSIGEDRSGRRAPLEQAVINGLISPELANHSLPEPISANVLALIKEKIPLIELVGSSK